MASPHAAPPVRPERHDPASITTQRTLIAHALVQNLPRCPTCHNNHQPSLRHSSTSGFVAVLDAGLALLIGGDGWGVVSWGGWGAVGVLADARTLRFYPHSG